MLSKYAYIWTFIAGFVVLTLALAVDQPVIEVLAAAGAVALFIATGALWQDEQIHQEYTEILNELREYQ